MQSNRKKILVMANVASMIVQFNMRNLEILQDLNYDVEVACNFENGNTCSEEVRDQLISELKTMKIPFYQIDFSRGAINIRDQFSAFKHIDELIRRNKYNVIFAQSTVAGIAARNSGKKYGCSVIYIAHGFQFYEGSSKFRWAIFYNLERRLSKKTDTLVLTNRDDYKLAKEKFHAKEILFVPGVGIDIEKFGVDQSFRRDKEKEKRGLKSDDYIVFSAGELSKRKNHKIVMETIRDMNNPRIKYLICGIGPLEEKYKKLIKKWGMEKQIFLLGYQNDLKSIYNICDLFIFPSINEGLPVCLLMSLAAKVNSICSDIRGNHELVNDKRYLFDPTDKKEIRKVIEYAMTHEDENKQVIKNNYENLQKYSSDNVDKQMKIVFSKYR